MAPTAVAPKTTSIIVSNEQYQQIQELQTAVEEVKKELRARQQQLRQIEHGLSARRSQINTLATHIAELERQSDMGLLERLFRLFRKRSSSLST